MVWSDSSDTRVNGGGGDRDSAGVPIPRSKRSDDDETHTRSSLAAKDLGLLAARAPARHGLVTFTQSCTLARARHEHDRERTC